MTQNAYLVWGNHLYTHGIGEIVFTVDASLGGYHRLRPTETIKPGKINIIIDEFSNLYFVRRLAEIKKEYPGTRYVFIATEFVTPIALLGLELGRTFNFFGNPSDWLNVLRNRNILLQATGRLPSYMHRRFAGFVDALPLCDVLAFVHPKIGPGLKELSAACSGLIAPPMALYPELHLDFDRLQEQWATLPMGFDITGTMSKYRRRVMNKLERRFALCGHNRPIWRHVPFTESDPLEFGRSTMRFHYDREGEPNNTEGDKRYLFNINPPQQAKWPFSSPMRIARAALLGQIPAITAKFNDHEIEAIAYRWDGKQETALHVMSLRIDRAKLLDSYIQAVKRYNVVAKDANKKFAEVLESILSKSVEA
jgi:hypothetical protein